MPFRLFVRPGALPETLWGDLWLLEVFVVYSYLLYLGCNLISDGAELLMLTPYSKLVGAVILPVLGAVPDGALVLFSGMGPSAQSTIDVGVGALAGSTVMLLTVPWALAIYGGSVPLEASSGFPKYAVARKGLPRPVTNYWKAGVCVGDVGSRKLCRAALWMLVTALPYGMMTCGGILSEYANGGVLKDNIDDDQAERLYMAESAWISTSALFSAVFFVAYLCYQYRLAYGPSPQLNIEARQLEATLKTVAGGGSLVAALRPLLFPDLEEEEEEEEELLQGGGETTKKIEQRPQRRRRQPSLLERLGCACSTSSSSSSEEEECLLSSSSDERTPLTWEKSATDTVDARLRSVLSPFFRKYDPRSLDKEDLGRVFADMNEPKTRAQLDKIFEKRSCVTFDDFCDAVKQLIRQGSKNSSPVKEYSSDEDADEIPEEFAAKKFPSAREQQRAIQWSAFRQCVLGTALVLVFSAPMTDVLDQVGQRTGVDSFYVGFVVAPLVTNGSELLASYTFALKKNPKSMVVAYEQLIGAAVMNNTFALFIFLILIYSQKLYWDYTSEAIAILFAEITVFCVITTLRVHTLYTAIAILSIYPLVIFIVYTLETFVGIS